MKTYNGVYGHTYYYKDGVLMGCPTFADGTGDYGNELPVADFSEPLTDAELHEVQMQLAENYNKELKSYFCEVCEDESQNTKNLNYFNIVKEKDGTIKFVCTMCYENGVADKRWK